MADNDTVPLMNGPQGGYHVWLSVGCEDCKNPLVLKYGAHDPATGEPFTGTGDLQAAVPLSSGEWPQKAGLIVYMPGLSWDPEYEPPPAKGTHIVLWAKAYDGSTLVHEDEVEVVIGDTMYWDPCEKNPDDPSCGLDGNGP
ncbi:MAG: hypothetical protein R3F14_20925 [Polyangiaceae bacterium]